MTDLPLSEWFRFERAAWSVRPVLPFGLGTVLKTAEYEGRDCVHCGEPYRLRLKVLRHSRWWCPSCAGTGSA